MPEIKIDRLIRSHRRTVGLEIDREGKLTVRVPLRMRQADIDYTVSQKADWIERNQATARARRSQFPLPKFVEGELFWYLGERYPLKIVSAQRPALTLQGEFRLRASAQSRARPVFIDWYRASARQLIGQRLVFFASLYGMHYKAVRITSARTKWGSCSRKGNLSFSWRLVMTPPDILDYVVVHELVHLREPNHSARFWNQVTPIVPDWKQKRSWLHQYAYLFDF